MNSGSTERDDSLPALLQAAMQQHQAGRLDDAESLYRRILAIHPTHTDALNLLGVIAHQTGRTQEAITLMGRAVLAEPSNPVFCSNLAQVLNDDGDHATAAGLCRRALAARPDYAPAHNNLGNALQAQEQNIEAANHYQTAIRLDPAFAEPHNNLGLLHQERGRLEAAIEHYRRAIALHPRLHQAHSNLGNALREHGDLAGAAAALQQALSIRPDFADAHAGLAGVHIDLGEFDRAQESVASALRTAPLHPAAWAAIPAIRKMTAADNDWLHTLQQLLVDARPPLTQSLRAKLHYALGKYYDDTKQYDLAFGSYQKANALKRAADGPFDREGFTKLVEAMIRVYTPDVVNRAWAGASDSTLPVLVCGMPRSGTSLTEQIIASHPSAFGAGELHYLNREARAHRPEILGGRLEDAFLRILTSGYEEHLRSFSPGAMRIVDKMPNNFQWLGLFHIAFPKAKIIHVRRHPVDTCLSIYFQNFRSAHTYGTDLDDLAFYYRGYQRLMDHWRSVLPADCLLEVDYEALVEDQEGGSRRIIDFLGLPWDDRCLDFHQTERKVGTASNWQVRQKIYKTSKARWRNYEKWVGPLRELVG